MTGPTPGPWAYDRSVGLVESKAREGDPLRIAYLSVSDVPLSEARANASIIAAAPDLVDALDRLIYRVEMLRRLGKIREDLDDADVDGLRDAIAAASLALSRARVAP